MTKNATTKSGAAGRARLLALTAAALAALTPLAPSARAAGPERSLAGVSIFDSGSVVTRRFGNPSRILVGGVGTAPANPTGGVANPGSPAGYPGGPPVGSSGTAGSGLLPGFPGLPTSSGGSTSSEFPGASGGFGSPSGGFSGSPGGFAGASGGILGGVAAPPVKPPVTLIYDRPRGGSLEFTISPDKRVIQIRETGYTGAFGTARGIRLGTSYSAVVARYGYQENTTIAGSIINIDYKDTLHCGFQFLDQKLVAIIVASPD